MSGRQLPLGIALRPAATFEAFIPGPNAEVIDALARLGAGESLFLWGASGAGKTHLLQAVCHRAAARGERALYLPLERYAEFAPSALEGLESLAVVCIDGLQAIAGREEWERALFALFNESRMAGGRLVLAADRAPRALALRLPDLASRLGWGAVFQLRCLDDDALSDALRSRARALGIDMPDEVVHYLLRRCVRDTAALFGVLERLDRESLAARRRLTVPFVRDVLDRDPPA